MDWSDPAARLRRLETVGPERYNRELAEHHRQSTVSVVNGHAIRQVGSRFGRLFAVGQTGRAFRSQADAEAFARQKLPGDDAEAA